MRILGKGDKDASEGMNDILAQVRYQMSPLCHSITTSHAHVDAGCNVYITVTIDTVYVGTWIGNVSVNYYRA